MTNAAFGQFRLGFLVTILTQGMGRILVGVDLFGHAGLAVVTGFAFFYFLPFGIGDFLAVSVLAVVANATL
jgi:hypothetical protein